MTSKRVPGKMLAPVCSVPLISKVVDSVLQAGFKSDRLLVVTSDQKSDDPLALYVGSLGISVFRGALGNVINRFVEAEKQYPCDWIIRVTGDSPFLSSQLLKYFEQELKGSDVCFITTTYRRTLPKGMNLEAFSAKLLHDTLATKSTNAYDNEQLTSFWHRNIPDGGLTSVELSSDDYSRETVAIDTFADFCAANNGSFEKLVNSVPWDTLLSRAVAR